MLKKMMGLGAAMALVGCGGGGDSANTNSTPQCPATQYLEANVCKNKASQSITGLSLPALTVGEKATLAATASSGLAVVYSSKTPTICSVSGSQVTAIKSGECSIAANQTGDGKTLAAPEIVVNVTVSVAFMARMKLPQTGITTCATADKFKLPCTKGALEDLRGLNQDGEVQAGEKISYTLLTQNGADCVKDNATGLVWEQKTDDGGLRDKDWLYIWYNPNGETNGGSAGYQDRRDADSGFTYSSCGDSLTQCNTQAYIAALNAARYCGYSDWRMPSAEELIGLVDFGRDNLSINPVFTDNSGNTSHFWSASPYAGATEYAWVLQFNYGRLVDSHKIHIEHIRAVRVSQ
jgi:hypothetical protein